MKKLFYLTLAVLAFAACNEVDPIDPNKKDDKSNTPIVLAADQTTPDMNPDTQGDAVLNLTWNATTNMGTGARIEYSILIDNKGGNFEEGVELNLGSNVTSYSFTGLDLNKIIKEELGHTTNGEVVAIDMCIYATIRSDEVNDVISNVVTINATAFEPKATVLYLIGSATEAGWDLTKAPEMSMIEGEDGGFTWSGELFGGELKFMCTRDGWVPSYNMGDDEEHLYYRDHLWEDENGNRVDDESLTHVDSPDKKFIIAEQGNYKITLNIDKLTISIVKTGGPKYFSMYMVGDALAAPQKMLRSSYAFIQGATLGNGGMHFCVDAEDSGDKYYAAAENQAYDAKNVSQTSGFNWKFGAERLYHVSLFAKEGKEAAYIVEFQPYETLYLIGSSTSAGWDIANALPMTKKSAYVQEWTGALTEGELKFSCDCSTDWFGAWYLASAVDKNPEGVEEPIVFIDKARAETASMGIKELDQKWKITQAGNYQITLDQQKETVIIKKL